MANSIGGLAAASKGLIGESPVPSEDIKELNQMGSSLSSLNTDLHRILGKLYRLNEELYGPRENKVSPENSTIVDGTKMPKIERLNLIISEQRMLALEIENELTMLNRLV